MHRFAPRRRQLLGGLAALPALFLGDPVCGQSLQQPRIARRVPATGESIPVIGMGSWITFDVGDLPGARRRRCEVLQAFFEAGGGMIDSSPMYGSAEEVIGFCLGHLQDTAGLISATKVWTPGRWFGVKQMEHSLGLWNLERFDLMQIHNMLDWETHLETLREWKAEGRIRYIGITTSHGRRHSALEAALRTGAFDFVQFTYNVVDREAERRLLPLAAELSIAVIINRPFRRGALFDVSAGKQLPEWAAEFDCANWAQFYLKYVVSHPAVTCTIPATSRVDHMRENMGALYGRLPDAAMRERMARHFSAL